MSIEDLDDERIRVLLNEVLDKREEKKQKLCSHKRSGTLIGKELTCDQCGKVLGEEDKLSSSPISSIEQAYITGKE